MASKSRRKKPSLLKPGMLTLAAVLLWAASHEPDSFSPAAVGIWVLGAASVTLLVRGALALAGPVLGLCGMMLSQAFQAMQGGSES